MEALIFGSVAALVGILRLLSKLQRRIEALEANVKTNNMMISRLQQQVSDFEAKGGE